MLIVSICMGKSIRVKKVKIEEIRITVFDKMLYLKEKWRYFSYLSMKTFVGLLIGIVT